VSVFGPVTDADRQRWQVRNLRGLTVLVGLGNEHDLPPLVWTLPAIGTVTGKIDALQRDRATRGVFEAWCATLAGHRRVEPRGLGLREEGEPRWERTDEHGRTRLMAGFTLRLTDRGYPSCEFVILAEWHEDDDTAPAGAW
jgi:hypothetical protein